MINLCCIRVKIRNESYYSFVMGLLRKIAMEIMIDETIEKLLDENRIYQARTGMGGKREKIWHRWKRGEKISYEIGCRIEPFSTFASGSSLYTCGSFSGIASNLRPNTVVGRYVEMGIGCKMMQFRHPVESVCMNSAVFNFARENVASYFEEYESANGFMNKNPVPRPQPQNEPLVIGNDVWVGNDCTLRGGITIHNGAVVASNSVVLEDVPPYAVVAGVPAKVKKLRFAPDIVYGLLESKWWEYELGDMYREGLDFSSPCKFLEKFAKVKSELRKYNPEPFVPAIEFYNPDFSRCHGALLTRWGTIVTLGGDGRLVHIDKPKTSIKVSWKHGLIYIDEQVGQQMILNGKDVNFNVDDSFSVEKRADGSVSIKLGRQYMSALPNGELSLVEQNLDWEHYYMVE